MGDHIQIETDQVKVSLTLFYSDDKHTKQKEPLLASFKCDETSGWL